MSRLPRLLAPVLLLPLVACAPGPAATATVAPATSTSSTQTPAAPQPEPSTSSSAADATLTPTTAPSSPAAPASNAPTTTPPTARPSSSAPATTAPAGGAPVVQTGYAKKPTVYLVESGTGTLGCGDKLVAARPLPTSTTPVRDAMTTLLSLKRESGVEGYVNGLAGSRLTFVRGAADHARHTVDVWLTGELRPSGTCDLPRIKAQLEMTAASAAQEPGVRIWINDKPLAQALSETSKG